MQFAHWPLGVCSLLPNEQRRGGKKQDLQGEKRGFAGRGKTTQELNLSLMCAEFYLHPICKLLLQKNRSFSFGAAGVGSWGSVLFGVG